jgi:hypothetical protein
MIKWQFCKPTSREGGQVIDNTSSEEEIRRELTEAIRAFGAAVAQANWTASGKEYARQNGSYTQPLAAGLTQGGSVTFHPDRVEWSFVCDSLSDTYLVVVREGGASWDLLHDRYGTGLNHAVLYNDELPTVQGVNNAQFWNISCAIRHEMQLFIERYLGGPPAHVPTAPASPSFRWKKEYTWIAVGIGVALMVGVCLICCVGNFLLAG